MSPAENTTKCYLDNCPGHVLVNDREDTVVNEDVQKVTLYSLATFIVCIWFCTTRVFEEVVETSSIKSPYYKLYCNPFKICTTHSSISCASILDHQSMLIPYILNILHDWFYYNPVSNNDIYKDKLLLLLSKLDSSDIEYCISILQDIINEVEGI